MAFSFPPNWGIGSPCVLRSDFHYKRSTSSLVWEVSEFLYWPAEQGVIQRPQLCLVARVHLLPQQCRVSVLTGIRGWHNSSALHKRSPKPLSDMWGAGLQYCVACLRSWVISRLHGPWAWHSSHSAVMDALLIPKRLWWKPPVCYSSWSDKFTLKNLPPPTKVYYCVFIHSTRHWKARSFLTFHLYNEIYFLFCWYLQYACNSEAAVKHKKQQNQSKRHKPRSRWRILPLTLRE